MVRVSVVIPVFNEERYLDRMLTSLDNQIHVSDEVICVIDCRTTDESEKIAHAHKCRVIISPPGKLTAREAGIRNSSAGMRDIIVAADADIYYNKHFIEEVRELMKEKDAVGVRGWTRIPMIPFSDLVMMIHSYRRMGGACSAFKKWAYYSTPGFNLSINQSDHKSLAYEEEVRFYNNLKKFGKIAWLWYPVYDMRGVFHSDGRRKHSDGFK